MTDFYKRQISFYAKLLNNNEEALRD